MKPYRTYQPGVPSSQEPPDRLIGIANAFRHPDVAQTGVTTTKDGSWALYVTVPGDMDVPIPSVESQSGGYPVVYEAEPNEQPVARPAYPDLDRSQGLARLFGE